MVNLSLCVRVYMHIYVFYLTNFLVSCGCLSRCRPGRFIINEMLAEAKGRLIVRYPD